MINTNKLKGNQIDHKQTDSSLFLVFCLIYLYRLVASFASSKFQQFQDINLPVDELEIAFILVLHCWAFEFYCVITIRELHLQLSWSFTEI